MIRYFLEGGKNTEPIYSSIVDEKTMGKLMNLRWCMTFVRSVGRKKDLN